MKTVTIGSLVASPERVIPARDMMGTFDYVDLGSVDSGGKRISSSTNMNVENAPSRARQKLSSGDIVVSTVRPNLNGVALVPDSLHGAVGSTGFSVLRPERVYGRFLFHWVRSRVFIDYLVARSTGANYPAVSDEIVRSAPIPDIDFTEQRRIAETLDEVDAQRSRRRVQVDSLDALVRSRLAAVVAQAPAGPALGDVAAFVRGVTFKPADVSGEGVPVMRTKNVQKRLDLSDVIRIPADLVRNEDKYLRPGDTLVSSANSYNLVGKCCFVRELPERSAIGGFVAALRPGPDVDPVFLHHWFNSDRIQETVRSFGNQTTNISNLNIKRTLTLRLPDVPLAAQREFAAVVAKIDAQRERIERALALEDELFASLQYRAFRGEL